jgi:hypothetical protein
MSFKVKNGQLSNEVLQVLNLLIEQDIDASCAFRLTRIIKHLSSIVEDKVKTEKKIFDKWVDRDDFGNPIFAKDELGNPIEDTVMLSDVGEFTKEMSELMSVENDVPYSKINFDDLKLQTAKVKDLIKIDFLFE